MADVLQAIKDLVHTYPPEVEAYLFGSRARGANRPDSDWDVLLLVDKEKITDDIFGRCSYALYVLGFDLGVRIKPVIMTQRHWEASKSQTLFPHQVIEERIPL